MKRREEQDSSNEGGFLKVITVLLAVVIILAMGFLGVYFGCNIKKVTIKGNKLHDDEEIKQVVLNDNYSWNSVYVFLKYKFKKPETIAFVDTVEVSLKSPTAIEIRVYEKNMIGYVYVHSTAQYAYIDKDGIVEELSTEKIDNVVQIKGLEVKDVKPYETLNAESKSLFKDLLTLTNTLQKYELSPKRIRVLEDKTFSLSYDDGIKVKMGKATNLNEKAVRLKKIFPRLKGLKGTLHLEDWENESSDITFEKEK
ncbi:MAG: cell division protein FtsQ/DivIB [Lachnospiraceae bacterium]|nr:cell division protein FtsQ/DivIB [Lachnospiraceae bacterium]